VLADGRRLLLLAEIIVIGHHIRNIQIIFIGNEIYKFSELRHGLGKIPLLNKLIK
jgi:hypothetical protein